MKKKMMFILMLFFMAIIFTPKSVSATDGTLFSGGDGSAANPYKIVTAQDFHEIAVTTNAGNNYSGKYFKLMNDISLAEYESWTPIGAEHKSAFCPFSGIFDGDNHVITNLNLSISGSDPQYSADNTAKYNYIGLFGYVKLGTIKNVIIDSPTLNSLGTTNEQEIGAGFVVGYLYTNSTIDNCHVFNGTLTGRGSLIGGLTGDCTASKIINSSIQDLNANIIGTVGGIVGTTYYSSSNTTNESNKIENCVVTGNITGSDCAGGIASSNYYSDADKRFNYINCVVDANVSSPIKAGGLIGTNTVKGFLTNCIFYGTVISETGTKNCLYDVVEAGSTATNYGVTATSLPTLTEYATFDASVLFDTTPANFRQIGENSYYSNQNANVISITDNDVIVIIDGTIQTLTENSLTYNVTKTNNNMLVLIQKAEGKKDVVKVANISKSTMTVDITSSTECNFTSDYTGDFSAVSYGQEITFTFTPIENYCVYAIDINGTLYYTNSIKLAVKDNLVINPKTNSLFTFSYSVASDNVEYGTVNCDYTGDLEKVPYYQSITLTATPNPGHFFVAWKNSEGVVLSNKESFTFNLTANTNVIASFIPDMITPFFPEGSIITNDANGQSLPWVYYEAVASEKPSNFVGTWKNALTSGGNGVASSLSSISAIIQSSGLYTFKWYVSSETRYDYATVLVNDVEKAIIGKETAMTDWQEVRIGLNAGDTIKWVYRKDGSGNTGLDRVFITDFNKLDGSATVNYSSNDNDLGTIAANFEGNSVTLGFEILLTPSPKPGYLLDYWSDGNGNRISIDNEYRYLISSTDEVTIVGHFKEDKISQFFVNGTFTQDSNYDERWFYNKELGKDTLKSNCAGINNGISSIEYKVNENGLYSFEWFVSSEDINDGLRLIIKRQGDAAEYTYAKISGVTTSWKTVYVSLETNDYIRWEYYKNSSINTGDDCGMISNIQKVNGSSSLILSSNDLQYGSVSSNIEVNNVPLGTKFILTATPTANSLFSCWKDYNGKILSYDKEYIHYIENEEEFVMAYFHPVPTLESFFTDGVATNDATYPWAFVYKNDIAAIKSTSKGKSGSTTVLSFKASKNALYAFDWYASSESASYDYLAYYVNGELKTKIGGTSMVDWQTIYVALNINDVIEWKYIKDGSVDKGDDCGYISNFKTIEGSAEVVFETNNSEYGTIVAKYGDNVSFNSGDSVSKGNTITLTPQPIEGKKFFAWINEQNQIISYEATFTYVLLDDDRIYVKAILGGEDEFEARINGAFYNSFIEAINNAKSGEEVLVIKNNLELNQNITIPEGVIVTIPMNVAGNKYIEGTTSTATARVSWSSEALITKYKYFNFTIADGVTLTINGTLNLGGVLHYPDQSAQAHTSGAYSEIINNGTIIINKKGTFDVYGRVTGNGTISVYGNLYQPFMICDYSGGSNTQSLFNLNQTPFNRYAMVNIECEFTIYFGGVLYGHASLYFWSSVTTIETPFITYENSGETALIILKNGASAKIKYDNNHARANYGANTEDVGKTTIEITGGADSGYMEFPLGINTSAVYFSVPYNFEVTLKNGIYDFKYKYKFMPGSKLIVDHDATVVVSSGLYIYNGLLQSNMSGKSYPKTETLVGAGYTANANFILNGRLIVKTGKTFGGIIQTNREYSFIEIEDGANITNNNIVDGGKGAYANTASYFNLPAQVWNGTTLVNLVVGKIYIGSQAQWQLDSYYTIKYTTAANGSGVVTAEASDITTVINQSMIGQFVEDSDEYITLSIGQSNLNIIINDNPLTTNNDGNIILKVRDCGSENKLSSITYKYLFESNALTLTITDETVYSLDIVNTIEVDSTSKLIKKQNEEWSVKALLTYFNKTTKVVDYIIGTISDENTLVFDNIECTNTNYTVKLNVNLKKIINEMDNFVNDLNNIKNATNDADYITKYNIAKNSNDSLFNITTLTQTDINYINNYISTNNTSGKTFSTWGSNIVTDTSLETLPLRIQYAMGERISENVHVLGTYAVTFTLVDGSTKSENVRFLYNIKTGVVNPESSDTQYNNSTFKISEYENKSIIIDKRVLDFEINNYNITTIYGSSYALSYTINNRYLTEDVELKLTNLPTNYGIYNSDVVLTGEDKDNYIISNTSLTVIITINKKDVNVTINNQSSVYDGTEPIIDQTDYEVTGLVGSDKLNVVLTKEAGIDAKEYYIKGVNSNTNYNVTFTDGKFIINPKNVNATIKNQTAIYNKKEPIVVQTAYEVSDLINDDKLNVVLTKATGINVGTYEINGENLNTNYNVTFTKGEYSITPKAIDVDINDQTSVYSGTEPVVNQLAYTTDDLEENDSLIVVLTKEPGVIVDKYTITGVNTNKNYNVTFTNGEFSITKATYDMSLVTYTNTTLIYNGEERTLLIAGNLPTGVTVSYVSNKLTMVGETIAIASFLGDAENYELINPLAAVLKIDPKSINVTISNQTSIYDGNEPTVNQTSYTVDGLVKNDTLSVVLNKVAGINVGEYVISGTNSNKNYKVTFTEGKFKINPKPITVVINNQTAVYNGNEPLFNQDDYKINDLVGTDKLNVVITKAAGVDVAEYAITGTYNNSNYKVTFTDGIYSITKASINTPIINFTKTSSTISIQEVENAYYRIDGGDWSTNNIFIHLIANTTYKVEVYIKGDKNYFDSEVASQNITLDNKLSQTITFTNIDKLYTDADFDLNATVDSGKEIKYSVTTNDIITLNGKNVSILKVGSINITASVEEDFDYSASSKTITLTVSPANFEDLSSVARDEVYNGQEYSLILTGTIPEPTITTVVYSKHINAGKYDATITISNPNYNKLVITKELKINAKNISVIINNQTAIYSGAEPQFDSTDYTIHDIIGDDKLNVVITKAPGINVDKYSITGTYNNSNYNVEFTDGEYSITPKYINATIANQEAIYNGSEPVVNQLAYVANNLIGEDTLNVVLTKAPGVIVSQYAITGVNSNVNYHVTFTDGLYTINKATYDMSAVTFENTKLTYNGEERSLLIKGTLPFGVEVNYENNKLTNVGEVNATVKFNGDSHNYYLIPDKQAKLTIIAKDINVTINNQSAIYNGAEPIVKQDEYIAYDLINEDSLDIVLTKVKGFNVNTYAITGVNSNKNYNVTFTNGVYTITPKEVIVNINNQTSIYNKTEPVVKQDEFIANDLVNDDDLHITLTKAPGITVSEYEISGQYNNDNYKVTFVKGTYTITKLTIEVKWQNTEFTYNGNTNSILCTIINKQSNDDVVVELEYSINNNVVEDHINANNYQVKVVGLNGNNSLNYQLPDVVLSSDFIINPQSVVAAISGINCTYNGTNQAVNISLSKAIAYQVEYNDSIDIPDVVGKYNVEVISTDSNYVIKHDQTTLTINKLDASIDYSCYNELIYDFEIKDLNPTITNKANNDTISDLITFTIYKDEKLVSNVKDFGSYKVVATLSDYTIANYNITNQLSYTFNVSKLTVDASITLVANEFTYNGTNINPISSISFNKYNDLITYNVNYSNDNYNENQKPMNIGTYNILIVTTNDNVIINNKEVKYIINPIKLQYQLVNQEVTYNKELRKLQVNFLNIVEGDKVSLDFTYTLNDYSSTEGAINVGTYNVEISQASNNNYIFETITTSLIINKAKINVTAISETTIYGEVPTLAYDVTGLIGDDKLNGHLSSLGIDVGSYDILLGTLNNDNYEINFTSKLHNIEPLTVSIVWTYDDLVYDATNQFGKIEASYVNVDAQKTIINITEQTLINADTYHMVVVDDLLNYELINNETDIVISPLALDVRIENQSSTYNGLTPVINQILFTVTTEGYNELLTNFPLSISLFIEGTYLDADSYTIKGSNSNSNYKVSFTNGTYTIKKALPNIDANDLIVDYDGTKYNILAKSYEDAVINYYYDGKLFDGAINAGYYEILVKLNESDNYLANESTYSITINKIKPTIEVEDEYNLVYNGNNQLVNAQSNSDGIISYSVDEVKNVGLYLVSVLQAEGTNYLPTKRDIVMIISEKPITVTIENQTSIYDGKEPVIDQMAYNTLELCNDDTLEVVLTKDFGKIVGEYQITGINKNKNYDVTFIKGKYSITKKTIKVDINNQTSVYDGTEPTINKDAYVINDLVAGDDISVKITKQLGYTADEYQISGTYENSNYDVNFQNGIYTITPKAVNVTINNQTAIYNGQEPLVDQEAYLAYDLIGEDKLIVVLTKAVGINVNEYIISGVNNNINYNVTFTNGVYTITPKAVNVTINNQTAIYNGQEPLVDQEAYIAYDLIGEDTLTVVLTKENGVNVNEYVISGINNNENYDVTFTNGTYYITKATYDMSLITFEDTTLIYNGQIRTLLINGNLPNGVEVTYENNELKNTGEIIATANFTGDDTNYYLIPSKQATLKINAKKISVIIDNKSSIYNEELADLTCQIKEGLVNNDELIITLTKAPGDKVGLYEITGINENTNYDVEFVKGVYEIISINAHITSLVNSYNTETIKGEFEALKTIRDYIRINNETLPEVVMAKYNELVKAYNDDVEIINNENMQVVDFVKEKMVSFAMVSVVKQISLSFGLLAVGLFFIRKFRKDWR